jgi:secreted PhoX family phosphatase
MDKKHIAYYLGATLIGSLAAYAAPQNGPFGFEPLAESASSTNWNPSAPWKIPEGFVQFAVKTEADLNIYDGGRDDLYDMNTVNETGRQAGRYIYTTHEIRNAAEGGSMSAFDTRTGAIRVIAQDTSWTAIDGLVWTPWGSLLFAEETTGGRLFELVLDKKDPMSGTVIDRPAVGRIAHEGIEVGPDGCVYVIDEFRGQREGYGGGIYKFVPTKRNDLSEGSLYALKVTGNDDNTGQGEWVGPIDPADARQSGTDFGGTGYNRPEDIEIIGNTLYVAVTEGVYVDGVQTFDGRVLAVNLNSLEVSNFIKPGVNAPIEIGRPGDEDFQSGIDNPDNLAKTPDGKLIIVEDNVPSDIWIAEGDLDNDGMADEINLFASLTDPGAEGTGIYFGKNPKTLLVNVQHSAADDGDGTWAITKLPSKKSRHQKCGK